MGCPCPIGGRGDQVALHALHERAHRVVFTLSMRILANRESAEEVTVDVFHDVWRRASSYQETGGTVLGWIMNQARSRAIDRLRFEQRRKRVPPETGNPLPAGVSASPDDMIASRQQRETLRRALEVLTPDERQAIETAFFSELPYADVAARLQERIAAELLVKLGIQMSPRAVRRYLPSHPAPRLRIGSQAWSTFVRNHARAVLACDFFVVVTATFRLMYVFVVLDVGTRRIMHWNTTEHPGAAWTAQQFRMIVAGDEAHRFVIHDRDSIYSEGVDGTLSAMGLTVLRTPVRAPQANACCERLIGTIRRECLDFFIPLTESHLRAIPGTWVTHYNRGRPHGSLGPGLPDPPPVGVVRGNGHELPEDHPVVATPILAGLHHEYRLKAAA